MRPLAQVLQQKRPSEKRAALVDEVAKKLANSFVEPRQAQRVLRYLYSTKDVKNAREVLRRFARQRHHFGGSLPQKRQAAVLERELFKLLRVSDDVDDLILLISTVINIVPYYRNLPTGESQ